eukprot:g29954.t1
MLRSRRWSAVTLTVRGFSNEGGSPFGRNWAAGILETSPPPKLAERPRRRGVGLPNRLLGALALLRDPRELDSEGLGKAATAAAREGLEEDAWWQGFTERTKDIVDTLAMHDVSLILNGMARARRLDKDLVALLIPRICSNLVYLTSAHLAMLSSSIAKADDADGDWHCGDFAAPMRFIVYLFWRWARKILQYLNASDYIAGTLAISAMGVFRDASQHLMKMLCDWAVRRLWASVRLQEKETPVK